MTARPEHARTPQEARNGACAPDDTGQAGSGPPGAASPAHGGETRTVSLADVKARLMAAMRADGMQFSRCANCGDVYPLGEDSSTTVCGDRCEQAYIAYLTAGL